MNKGTSEKNRKPLWITLGAAAACLGIAGGIIAMSMNSISVTAGAEAVYPKMAHYPDESALTFEQDYDSWWSDRRAQLDPSRRATPTACGISMGIAPGNSSPPEKTARIPR